MHLNAGPTYSRNLIPIICATFWMISESLFGSTHSVLESLALGIFLFGMISESRFVDTLSVVEHTTLGILIFSVNDSSYYELK